MNPREATSAPATDDIDVTAALKCLAAARKACECFSHNSAAIPRGPAKDCLKSSFAHLSGKLTNLATAQEYTSCQSPMKLSGRNTMIILSVFGLAITGTLASGTGRSLAQLSGTTNPLVEQASSIVGQVGSPFWGSLGSILFSFVSLRLCVIPCKRPANISSPDPQPCVADGEEPVAALNFQRENSSLNRFNLIAQSQLDQGFSWI